MKRNMLGRIVFQCIMGASLLMPAANLMAQDEPAPKKASGTIAVSGSADMNIVADHVAIQIVADHTDANAREAYKMTTEEMSKAIAYLKKRGDIENIKTTQVMLYPRVRDYKSGAKEYNARQTLNFELKKLENYDEVMLSLIDMGINGVGNVQFKSTEEENYEEVLMRKAVQDARKKAVILASELGQEVGAAKVIDEQGNAGPYPMTEYKMAFSSDSSAGGGDPSVSPGTLKITKTIQIQFELK
ncbi:SIMPL domain-containing protein [Owenweeksia hongkongensis]|uniref:SIMPL domain-containing protein n=1 Tax=Owenweeksia hongkongensis TaxID=253245 RepID=UPI003A9511D2